MALTEHPFRMNDFTPRAQHVLALARQEAKRLQHSYVGTEHLLLGLIKLGQGTAVDAIRHHTDPLALKQTIEHSLNATTVSAPTAVAAPPTPPAKPDRPYLLFDNSVQWFGAVARVAQQRDSDHAGAFREVPSDLWNCPFVSNLTAREPHHFNLPVNRQTWMAWALSEAEFGRLVRILDLQPSVVEQRKLVGLS